LALYTLLAVHTCCCKKKLRMNLQLNFWKG